VTANFTCPTCGRSTLDSASEDAMYECTNCGRRAHVVVAAREDLEDLAASDLPCSDVAEKLLQIAQEYESESPAQRNTTG
jgi:transcription elongation factor Elf1